MTSSLTKLSVVMVGTAILKGNKPKGKDALELGIPKGGATFSWTIVPSCTIALAPKRAVEVKGKYNGSDTDTMTNSKITEKGSGCTSAYFRVDATVVLSPAPGAPPW
jgi:hypothetical protein